MNRAVFLDRDGTLIVEKEYLHKVAEVEIYPDAAAALQKLQATGFKLIIVTNQAGMPSGSQLMGEELRCSGGSPDQRWVRIGCDQDTHAGLMAAADTPHPAETNDGKAEVEV